MIKYGWKEGVTHEWTAGEISELSLPSGYDSPVVLAAMQTFNGPDTAGVRMKSLRDRSFEVKIEEELSLDPEVKHVAETIGHIAFAPFLIQDINRKDIGYASFFDIQQRDRDFWMALPIPANFSIHDSVVFAQILTCNGPDPVHPRIRKEHPFSGTPGFYLKLEEWPTYDPWHTGERVGIVVLKKGSHRLFGQEPELIVGEMNGVDHTWQKVDVPKTSGAWYPVLVTQCQTCNGVDPVVTRQRETDARGFEARLQEAESQGAHVIKESVAYVQIGVFLV